MFCDRMVYYLMLSIFIKNVLSNRFSHLFRVSIIVNVAFFFASSLFFLQSSIVLGTIVDI